MPEHSRTAKRTTTWYVHAYRHADDSTVLPVGEASLDGLRFGGKRNYGYDETRVEDTRVVELDALDFSRLETAEGYLVELLTPYVLDSTYPGTNGSGVPGWWGPIESGPLRRRREMLVHHRKRYAVDTIDHGQVVEYTGRDPIETAKTGMRRLGPRRKYGFGECRVIPVGAEK